MSACHILLTVIITTYTFECKCHLWILKLSANISIPALERQCFAFYLGRTKAEGAERKENSRRCLEMYQRWEQRVLSKVDLTEESIRVAKAEWSATGEGCLLILISLNHIRIWCKSRLNWIVLSAIHSPAQLSSKYQQRLVTDWQSVFFDLLHSFQMLQMSFA